MIRVPCARLGTLRSLNTLKLCSKLSHSMPDEADNQEYSNMNRNNRSRLSKLVYAAALLCPLLISNNGFAQEKSIDSYYARLSKQDHFNSSGNPLTKVEGIIQQDRANVYALGRRDHEDNLDYFFAIKENRALIGTLIANSRISDEASAAIINGTPLVFVQIYKGYITIKVMPE